MTLAYDPGRAQSGAVEPGDPRRLDRLTGLCNRQALDADSRDLSAAGHSSVLVVDVDQFGAVNDTYGHDRGDDVLRVLGARLRSVVDGRHLVARLGGGEFAIVLGSTDRGECEALAAAAHRAIREPIELGGGTLFLDAGIGIALPDGERSVWELVSRAGAAIHALKHDGRLPRMVVFDELAHGEILERSELTLDLRGALTRDELVVEYQPIVDMATRDPVGYEALVRWRHPTRGLIAPLRFIPLAEAGGLMPELGEWVLAEACREAMSWSGSGPQPLYVSVNVSIRQLEDPSFIGRFRRVVAESGLDARRLKVELTESVIADGVHAVAPLLAEVRAMGVGVLLDDFGTGYSSLGYVRDLPLDAVKLDRVFSRDLTISAAAWTLARSVVTLFGQLGLEIIAEGLETAAHLAQLRSLGCRLGQGFYFAEPRAPERLELDRGERVAP